MGTRFGLGCAQGRTFRRKKAGFRDPGFILKVALSLVERVKRNDRIRLALGGETLKDAVKTRI